MRLFRKENFRIFRENLRFWNTGCCSVWKARSQRAGACYCLCCEERGRWGDRDRSTMQSQTSITSRRFLFLTLLINITLVTRWLRRICKCKSTARWKSLSLNIIQNPLIFVCSPRFCFGAFLAVQHHQSINDVTQAVSQFRWMSTSSWEEGFILWRRYRATLKERFSERLWLGF